MRGEKLVGYSGLLLGKGKGEATNLLPIRSKAGLQDPVEGFCPDVIPVLN